MEKKSTEQRFGSRDLWESLEDMARGRIQQFIQDLVEEEVAVLVGRRKSKRRPYFGEYAPVYRIGHGKPRRLSMSCGTLEVRRPRVRSSKSDSQAPARELLRRIPHTETRQEAKKLRAIVSRVAPQWTCSTNRGKRIAHTADFRWEGTRGRRTRASR